MRKELLALLLASAMPVMASAANTKLVDAVKTSDHAAIKKLATKASVNAPLPDKSTALAWAVDRQDEESVKLLLAAGAKPNVADVSGATPLMLACELGQPGIVSDLLKAGASAKQARPDGISVLALCAGSSTTDVLGQLTAQGADVNAADQQGQTPLMWAAMHGRTDNIKFLLAHGANVNAVEQKGFTPLFFALRSKNNDAAMALLNAGADYKAILPDDGTSIAAAAIMEGNTPFASEVVSRGVDLNQRDKEGRQLIHVAAANGNADVIKLILAKGGNANAMSAPPKPAAPVLVAANVPALAGGGGDGKKKGLAVADGAAAKLGGPATPAMPALMFAAKAGSAPAMKALVDGGANPDIEASDGTTLALASASGGNLAALKYGLTLDPDIDAIGPGGKSIMHYAIANKEPTETIAMVQYLIDEGANLAVADKRGDTPGDFINRGGQQDIRLFYMQVLKDRNITSVNH
jgi:ankyrin repeat protein